MRYEDVTLSVLNRTGISEICAFSDIAQRLKSELSLSLKLSFRCA